MGQEAGVRHIAVFASQAQGGWAGAAAAAATSCTGQLNGTFVKLLYLGLACSRMTPGSAPCHRQT